jgi:carboxypeptidase Q
MDQFKKWGLKDVRADGFDFGRGWWIESVHVRMTQPRPLELRGIPIAWTPPTNGTLNAAVIVAPMQSDKDFADWKGQLKDKIVLVTWPAPPKDDAEAPFQRLSDADIVKLDKYQQPSFDPEARQKRIDRYRFRTKLDNFLAEEGAVAWVQMSRTEGRLVSEIPAPAPKSAMISRAALWPGAPVTPPPGWVPEGSAHVQARLQGPR